MAVSTEQRVSLRAALWLYALVSLSAAAIILSLFSNFDPQFLRLSLNLFVVLGFTFVATFLVRISPYSLFGRVPTFIGIVLGFLAGLAIWVPASWALFVVNGWLNTSLGLLPNPLRTGAGPVAQVIQLGLMIPFCQSFMFWGFIQHAAEPLGKNRAAVLAGCLYGLFGLFATGDFVSAVSGLLVVGLLAAFVVRYTDSVWSGFAVAAGYGLARPLFEETLFNFLGDQAPQIFGLRWLAITLIGAFLAFVLLQVIRVRSTVPAEASKKRLHFQSSWLAPMILVVIIGVFCINYEVKTRRDYAASGSPQIVVPATPGTNSGSTIPPIAPSQTPQPANK